MEEEVEEVEEKVEVDLCQVSNWYRCTGGHLCQVSKLDPNVDLDGEIRSTKKNFLLIFRKNSVEF